VANRSRREGATRPLGVVAVVVVRSSGRKARIELAGAAGGFAVAKPASDVRERTLVPPRGGAQAVPWCARGLCWLQKSTSGVWSSRKAMGLALRLQP
jgi:hypothetical protein